MTWKQFFCMCLLLVVLGSGCRSRSPVPTAAPDQPESPAAESATTGTPAEGAEGTAAAPSIPLRLASWEDTEKLIAAQRGKVVVLDVWSTWCAPCMKEFSNLVELQKRFGDKVVCLSLNCNYAGIPDEPPEQARPAVEKFLQSQGATFDNLICTDSDEQLFQKLGIASIPVVRVYDESGQLSKQFVNDSGEYGPEGFTYRAHIVPWVEKLLQ